MSARLSFCLVLLFISYSAAAVNIYDDINAQRNGGNCPAAQLKTLIKNTTLEKIAASLAHGEKLKEAIDRKGYKATQADVISIKSSSTTELTAAKLAMGGYCTQLQNPAFLEAGVYQDAHQLWVVLAAPFPKHLATPEGEVGPRILKLINQARASARNCGTQLFPAAPPVIWNDTLASAAKRHSADMARFGYFDHVGNDGSTPADRVAQAGYTYQATGENIAAGQPSPETVVEDWINSPHHCANLMNSAFTEMGIGLVVDPNSKMGVYWTQVFGKKQQGRPLRNPSRR